MSASALTELVNIEIGKTETLPMDRIQRLLKKIGPHYINDVGKTATMGYKTNATPLDWAIESKQLEIVKAVVEAGADVNYQINTMSVYISHPLEKCVGFVSVPIEITEYLLEKGSNPNIPPLKPTHGYSHLIKTDTPYQIAIKQERYRHILAFLEAGYPLPAEAAETRDVISRLCRISLSGGKRKMNSRKNTRRKIRKVN